MPKVTLTELRETMEGRPENTEIVLDDGTEATLLHIMLMPHNMRDTFLNALEKFMSFTVDENSNRADRRAADKAAGRKVGSTKAAKPDEAEKPDEVSAEDVADTIRQLREGLIDADKIHDAAGELISAAIVDKAVAKTVLSAMDTMDRAALINVHLGAPQQGEAQTSA